MKPIATSALSSGVARSAARVSNGLPWEIELWRRRKPGRRVEREAGGAVALVEALSVTEARAKLDCAELRRTYPSLTAACAAVAL